MSRGTVVISWILTVQSLWFKHQFGTLVVKGREVSYSRLRTNKGLIKPGTHMGGSSKGHVKILGGWCQVVPWLFLGF